jgi:hypothetical protein
VGEALARAGLGVAFQPLRLAREAITSAGGQETLRSVRGLSAAGVVAAVEGLR